MKNFSIELAAERIVDHRTREYFQEVLGSFIHGNYRSAVVMLWSVVVTDLVYKLKSLHELYQDPVADSILKDIEKKQKDSPQSPDWELLLLEEVRNRTHLLEGADYQHLINLQKLRHLSSHPVLTNADLLFSPNKETTRALIRNALEGVLLKPAFFTRKVINEFVEDLASVREILPDRKALEQYLEAKYFKSLHPSIEHALIKTLWKFCFRISNLDTDANRTINTRTLHLLYSRNPTVFRARVAEDQGFFGAIATQGTPLKALILFLAKCPDLYGVLDKPAQILLAGFVRNDVNLSARAFFLGENFLAHLERLGQLPMEQLQKLSWKTWQFLLSEGKQQGESQAVYTLGIRIYAGSRSFNEADVNYEMFIRAHIDEYDCALLNQLLEGIDGNDQTYRRGKARVDHLQINSKVRTTGEIDLAKYPGFTGSLPEGEE